MQKKKLIALAGFMFMVPLSETFTRNAAPQRPATGFSMNAQDLPRRTLQQEAFTAAAVNTNSRWLDEQGMPNADAHALLAHLQNAPSHGLNPASYKTDDVAALLEKPGIPEAGRAGFEQTLNNALVAYVQDMSGPRVSPTVIGSKTSYWRKALTKTEVLAQYSSVGSLDQMLQDLAPKTPLYAALQTEMTSLLALPASDAVASKKIVQVAANLERLRWDLPRPERYVEVNIADQTLIAVDSGAVVHHIDMIVGKTTRQTTEFTVPITAVKFNPTWHVPVSLMMRDKVPVLKKNPYAFESKELYVYRDGKKVDPGTINWNSVGDAWIRAHITMKQMPGPHNALGHVVVTMPNPHVQFLHYTNQPELFAKEPRYFSSGCMRMSQPDTIAAFLLGVDMGQLEEYKKGGGDYSVKVPAPATFFSVYHSITLNADGTLNYHKDAYGRDKKIYDALKKNGDLPPRTAPQPAPKVAGNGPTAPGV